MAEGASSGAARRDRDADKPSRLQASALEECLREKGIDEAWNLLEQMQQANTDTDKFSVSRMLMRTVSDARGPQNSERVYRGIALVERFIEKQPGDVDEVLFNALLDTCCRLRDVERLEACMKKMRELKIKPSAVTLGILVKSYGHAGDLPKVLAAWAEMSAQRHQANAVTYGCMLDACVKCGDLAKALEVFDEMKRDGKHRNTILYTTLIKGHGLEKNFEGAISLFHEMKVEGVPYNTITYNSIVDVCIRCGKIQEAEDLVAEMMNDRSSVEPDLITFSTLLKGYCQQGQIEKALKMSETIAQRGLRRDELVYNTLMDGCVKANDISTCLALFEEMIKAGMKPSPITHSILQRMYKRAGYENDANEVVAQLFSHHGIEQPSDSDRNRMHNRMEKDSFKLRSPPRDQMGGKGGGKGVKGQRCPPTTPTPGDCILDFMSGPSMSQTSMGGQGLFLPVENLSQGLRSPHQLPAFPNAFGMQMNSPMNSMNQMNGQFQLFQGSGAGTPASCCTPASCTPGNTPFGGSSFGSNFFGMQNMGDNCTTVTVPEGVNGPALPPWPPESSFTFPPVTLVGVSTPVSTPMAGTVPQFQETMSGTCTPMAGAMNQMSQSGCCPVSGASTSAPGPEPCPSPQRFGQGGCQGLSPGASPPPMRYGLSPGASPQREDCPGTPEQYASYPIPNGCTEAMQQPQFDFDFRNQCNDNNGPQCNAGVGQWCQTAPDSAQCMPYQGGVNMQPTMMMMSGQQMNRGFMQGQMN